MPHRVHREYQEPVSALDVGALIFPIAFAEA